MSKLFNSYNAFCSVDKISYYTQNTPCSSSGFLTFLISINVVKIYAYAWKRPHKEGQCEPGLPGMEAFLRYHVIKFSSIQNQIPITNPS